MAVSPEGQQLLLASMQKCPGATDALQDCIGLLRAAGCSSAQIWMVPCGQSFKGFSQKVSTNTKPLDHLTTERTQAERVEQSQRRPLRQGASAQKKYGSRLL